MVINNIGTFWRPDSHHIFQEIYSRKKYFEWGKYSIQYILNFDLKSICCCLLLQIRLNQFHEVFSLTRIYFFIILVKKSWDCINARVIFGPVAEYLISHIFMAYFLPIMKLPSLLRINKCRKSSGLERYTVSGLPAKV